MSDKTYIKGVVALLSAITLLIAVSPWLSVPSVLEWLLYVGGIFLAITGATTWYNQNK